MLFRVKPRRPYTNECRTSSRAETKIRLRVLQVIGGPAWMDTDLWEIQAKAAEDSVPPSSPADDNSKPDTIALMLQSLLEERFQLRLRHEMRDFPVYLLTVGKGGSKLK